MIPFNDKLPPCPHCGQREGFMVRGQIRGPIIQYYDNGGWYTEMYTDQTYTISSKTIRCISCTKIRKDVEFVETEMWGNKIERILGKV